MSSTGYTPGDIDDDALVDALRSVAIPPVDDSTTVERALTHIRSTYGLNTSAAEYYRGPLIKLLANPAVRDQVGRRSIGEQTDLLLAIIKRIGNIANMADAQYTYEWARIALADLRQIHELSGQLSKDLAIEMIRSGVLNPQETANLTGFSRQTIYTWLRAAGIDTSSLSGRQKPSP